MDNMNIFPVFHLHSSRIRIIALYGSPAHTIRLISRIEVHGFGSLLFTALPHCHSGFAVLWKDTARESRTAFAVRDPLLYTFIIHRAFLAGPAAGIRFADSRTGSASAPGYMRDLRQLRLVTAPREAPSHGIIEYPKPLAIASTFCLALHIGQFSCL